MTNKELLLEEIKRLKVQLNHLQNLIVTSTDSY